MSDNNIEALTKQADSLLDQGNLGAAYSVFDQICGIDAKNADAWFMKGSIDGEMGRMPQAVENITKAIDIDPEYAEAHYNLANLYRAAGQLDQAISHLENAVAIDDSFLEAYVMLGALSGQLGQTDKCETYSKRAVELQPDSAEANMNLANALQQNGKAAESIAYYQRTFELGNPPPLAYYMLARSNSIVGDNASAEENYKQFLTAQPDSADGWFALSTVLQEANKADEVRMALERTLQIKPDHGKAYANLAYLQRLRGEPEVAIKNYQKALELEPDSADILFNLGATLKDQSEFESALACFNRSLQINPEHTGALHGAGNVLQITGSYEQAIARYRKCTQQKKDFIEAYVGMSACYIAMGQQDQAVAVCNEALSIDPDNADTLISVAAALITLGEEQQALQNARKAMEIKPENLEARALVSTLYNQMGNKDQAYETIRENIENKQISTVNLALAFSGISKSIGKQQQAAEIMESLLAGPAGMSLKTRTNLHFALGKQYDSLKQFDAAFRHYAEGNRLKPVTFDQQQHEKGIREHLSFFTYEYMDSKPQASNTTEKPVFIVGMPRSGTSLVEQILASHPKIYGSGELPIIIKMVTAMQSLLNSKEPYPTCLNNITVEHLDALAGNYLSHINSLSQDADRIIDKMPGNFMNLGLIEMLFPKARIIHCQRNPIDTCLSGHFQDFSRSHPYSYNLDNLALYYNNYQKVMQHWRGVIKLPLMEIQYEELVENQAERSRDLVEFCGLEWDEQCLEFHETERFIGTASYEQVRQPMYNRSVARWRNYESHIQSLIDGLKPSLANH